MSEKHSNDKPRGVAGNLSAIGEIVEQTHHFEQSAYRIKKNLEKNHMLINRHMGKQRSITVKTDANTEFMVSKNVDIKIEFFTDKLREKLDDKRFKQIVDKKVVIPDYAELVKFLKSFGVPPKEFKKFIEVEYNVDNEKLDHLVDQDIISIEEIAGCYNADFEEEIKIKKIK